MIIEDLPKDSDSPIHSACFVHLQNEYGLSITMMSQGVCMLYSFFMGQDKLKERMNMNLSDVVQKVSWVKQLYQQNTYKV